MEGIAVAQQLSEVFAEAGGKGLVENMHQGHRHQQAGHQVGDADQQPAHPDRILPGLGAGLERFHGGSGGWGPAGLI